MDKILSEKRCSVCKEFKPISEFGIDRKRKDGLNCWCNTCRAIKRHERYLLCTDEIKKANAEYYFANQDKKKAYRDKWNSENKDRIRESRRKWDSANPEKRRLITQNYQSRKRQNGGSITYAEWIECLEEADYKCLRCGTTENLTMDHVIPVLLGGRTEKANIQVLCGSCNTSKRAKTIDYRKNSPVSKTHNLE